MDGLHGFLRKQGSVIVGVPAFAGGGLAHFAEWQQAKATKSAAYGQVRAAEQAARHQVGAVMTSLHAEALS